MYARGFFFPIQIHHQNALGHADLDRRKANAVGRIHRLDHVIDERADIRIDFHDGFRNDFQARIGRGKDGAYAHAPEIGFRPFRVKGSQQNPWISLT
jgi:hypothetical protein